MSADAEETEVKKEGDAPVVDAVVPEVKKEEDATVVDAVVTEVKKEEDSPVADAAVDAVVGRLAFFFSDANIRHDTYLRKLLTNDEKTVPIEALLKFNTIKQHTTDPEVVIKAAKAEKLSGLIELTEDSKAIKKVDEFTMSKMHRNIPVTIVVGNLPLKDDGHHESYAVKVEEISSLFDQYGKVILVKLRFGDSNTETGEDSKHDRKARRGPSGSALVEFEDEAGLKAAADDVLTRKDGVACEPKRKLELGGKELSAVLLRDFIDEIKKSRDGRQSKSGGKNEGENGGKGNEEGDKGFHMDWKPGCVLKLKELGGSCDREALLDAISQCLGKSVDKVKDMKIYVDYSRGQTEGAIRFQEPEGPVTEVLEKMKSGDVEVAGQKVSSIALLEGEEETKYWQDFIAFKSKQKRQRDDSKGYNNRGRNNKGHNNRGHNNKGYNNRDHNNNKRRRT